MPTIQDYMSGKICEQVKSAFSILESSGDSLKDTEVGKNLLNNVNKAGPKKFSVEEAIKLNNDTIPITYVLQGYRNSIASFILCHSITVDLTLYP